MNSVFSAKTLTPHSLWLERQSGSARKTYLFRPPLADFWSKLQSLARSFRSNRVTLLRKLLLVTLFIVSLAGGVLIFSRHALAAPTPTIVMPNIKIEGKPAGPQFFSFSLQMLMVMTILSLAPYILMMMTSFVRVTIVLSMIRSALGTQQVPPTQILMGLALFITFYIMAPVGRQLNDQTIRPYLRGEISQRKALTQVASPVRDFMLRQVHRDDLALFYELARLKRPSTREEVPLYVLTPAFMVSEIKVGFEIGFLIYIPFLIIDMVVASVLMSMGMFMLSPMTISLPFKLLLFVMVDGWELIIKGLVLSFH